MELPAGGSYSHLRTCSLNTQEGLPHLVQPFPSLPSSSSSHSLIFFIPVSIIFLISLTFYSFSLFSSYRASKGHLFCLICVSVCLSFFFLSPSHKRHLASFTYSISSPTPPHTLTGASHHSSLNTHVAGKSSAAHVRGEDSYLPPNTLLRVRVRPQNNDL